MADSTLVNHVTTVQSHLPPHVNLFIMLYGLNALARDLERARQEAYRNQVRAASGDDAVGAAKAVKLPGIGEKQPSKDDLELALIRCVRCSNARAARCDVCRPDLEYETSRTGYRCKRAACSSTSIKSRTRSTGSSRSRSTSAKSRTSAFLAPWVPSEEGPSLTELARRRLKHSHIAMLGTSEDKVVSGKDLQDTYIKMLASLPRVTEAMAKGIVAEYPTLRKLYESYERCRDEREMKEMLVGIGVSPPSVLCC